MSDTPKRVPMTPTKLSSQDYARTVGSHLKNREGAVSRIYTDGKGIPTMGTGIALAVSGDGGQTFTLRNLNQIGAEISGDPARPYRFTAEETKLLSDTVGKLNDPKLDNDTRKAEAQKLIPPYNPRTETPSNNKFGFTLSDERIAQQAEAAWTEHRDRAMGVVRSQAKARGWSKEQTDAYIESLKGSKQEIALTSLAFNGVRSPKAIGAMLDGDPVTMRQEILYRANPPSNGTSRTGIADRRKDEANLATAGLENWTPQQREQWQRIGNTPEATRYRATFPETFPQFGPPIPPKDEAPQPTSAPAGDPESSFLQGPEQHQGKQGIDWASLGDKALHVGKELIGIKSAEAAEAPPEQKAPIDPRAAAIAEQAAAPLGNPGQAALVKPHQTWTEGEMKDALTYAQTAKAGDPLRAHAYEKTQDWHTHVYGDGEQQYDGGKPVEPQALVAVPKEPSPPRTPEGEDLYQAAGRIGQKVANAVGLDGLANAVKGLQRGLNMLGQQPMPARSPAWGPYTKQPPLVEDGQYGPKTDFALKQAVGRFGAPKVENTLALGRFNTFARQAQSTGNVDGLESQTHAVFGPLFRNPTDSTATKVEAGVLQETLNGFGHDLKVDNWIGPKTTAAFGQTLKDEDADSLTTAFGRGLGLL